MSDGNHAPKQFHFGQPAVVAQPFTHSGRDFVPGEEFPYKELGLQEWQMWGFFLASLVDFQAPPELAPPPAKPSKADKHAARGR